MKRLIIAFVAVGGLVAACGESSGSSNTTTTTTTIAKPEATTVEETLALGRPVVLAHASGENIHPHSTPFGYANAVTQGVDILDFDVQLTKDGVLIVHRDDTIVQPPLAHQSGVRCVALPPRQRDLVSHR